MTATPNSTSESRSTAESLAFFNTIPKCAEILSQPDLRVFHPRNPDTFFHATVRANNGVLKSVFVYQPANANTHIGTGSGTEEPRSSDFGSDDTDTETDTTATAPAANPRGYLLLHLGRGVSGQPGIAHGGFLATVLDQVTGTVIKASGLDGGRGAVTAYLNVGFRRPVRVPGVVVARAVVGRVEGRKIYVGGNICEADGQGEGEGVCVSAEVMFLVKRDISV